MSEIYVQNQRDVTTYLYSSSSGSALQRGDTAVFDGFNGYLPPPSSGSQYIAEYDMCVIGSGLTITNGFSFRTYLFNGALSGDGPINCNWGGATGQVWTFAGDVSGYTGEMTATKKWRMTFAGDSELNAHLTMTDSQSVVRFEGDYIINNALDVLPARLEVAETAQVTVSDSGAIHCNAAAVDGGLTVNGQLSAANLEVGGRLSVSGSVQAQSLTATGTSQVSLVDAVVDCNVLTAAAGCEFTLTGCNVSGELRLSAQAKSLNITGNDFTHTSLRITDVAPGTVINLSGNTWGTDNIEEILASLGDAAQYVVIDSIKPEEPSGDDYLTVFTVTNNASDANTEGSFRWALAQAEAYTGEDVPAIVFAPQLAGQTISVEECYLSRPVNLINMAENPVRFSEDSYIVINSDVRLENMYIPNIECYDESKTITLAGNLTYRYCGVGSPCICESGTTIHALEDTALFIYAPFHGEDVTFDCDVYLVPQAQLSGSNFSFNRTVFMDGWGDQLPFNQIEGDIHGETLSMNLWALEQDTCFTAEDLGMFSRILLNVSTADYWDGGHTLTLEGLNLEGGEEIYEGGYLSIPSGKLIAEQCSFDGCFIEIEADGTLEFSEGSFVNNRTGFEMGSGSTVSFVNSVIDCSVLSVAEDCDFSLSGCVVSGELRLSARAKNLHITDNDFTHASISITDAEQGTLIDLSGNAWGADTIEDIFASLGAAAEFVIIDGKTLNNLSDDEDASVFTVTNTSTEVSVIGSLPWAVSRLNNYSGEDLPTIRFGEELAGGTITGIASLSLNKCAAVMAPQQGVHLTGTTLNLQADTQLQNLTLAGLVLSGSPVVEAENVSLTGESAIVWKDATGELLLSGLQATHANARIELGSEITGEMLLRDYSALGLGYYRLEPAAEIAASAKLTVAPGAVLSQADTVSSIRLDGSLILGAGSVLDMERVFLTVNRGGELCADSADIRVYSMTLQDAATLTHCTVTAPNDRITVLNGGVLTADDCIFNSTVIINGSGRGDLSNCTFNSSVTLTGETVMQDCTMRGNLRYDGESKLNISGICFEGSAYPELYNFGGSAETFLSGISALSAAAPYVTLTGSIRTCKLFPYEIGGVALGYRLNGSVRIAREAEVEVTDGQQLMLGDSYTRLDIEGTLRLSGDEEFVAIEGNQNHYTINICNGGLLSLKNGTIAPGAYSKLWVEDGGTLEMDGGALWCGHYGQEILHGGTMRLNETRIGAFIINNGLLEMQSSVTLAEGDTRLENYGTMRLTECEINQRVYNTGTLEMNNCLVNAELELRNLSMVSGENNTLSAKSRIKLSSASGDTLVLKDFIAQDSSAELAIELTGCSNELILRGESAGFRYHYQLGNQLDIYNGSSLSLQDGAVLTSADSQYGMNISGSLEVAASHMQTAGTVRVRSGGSLAATASDIETGKGVATESGAELCLNDCNISTGEGLTVVKGAQATLSGNRISGVLNLSVGATYTEIRGNNFADTTIRLTDTDSGAVLNLSGNFWGDGVTLDDVLAKLGDSAPYVIIDDLLPSHFNVIKLDAPELLSADAGSMKVVFNYRVSAATLTKDNVYLTDTEGKRLDFADISLSADGKTAVFSYGSLPRDGEYTLVMTEKVTSQYGAVISGDTLGTPGYSHQFRADVTPETIVSLTAQDSANPTRLTLCFSGDIAPGTVSKNVFALMAQDGSVLPVTGCTVVDARTVELAFAPLPVIGEYSLLVNPGITDAAGNALTLPAEPPVFRVDAADVYAETADTSTEVRADGQFRLPVTLVNRGSVAAEDVTLEVWLTRDGSITADSVRLMQESITDALADRLTLNPVIQLGDAAREIQDGTYVLAVRVTAENELNAAKADNLSAAGALVVKTPVLSLVASANTAREGGEALTYTVTRTGDCAEELTVQLNSEQAQRLGLPDSVTLAAGESSVSFTAAVVNDDEYTGDAAAQVTASAAGYKTSPALSMAIVEDETPALTLSVSATEIQEGSSTRVAYTVTRQGSTAQALTVQLSCEQAALLGLPETLTIAAGRDSVRYQSAIVDNNVYQGTQEVNISVSAEGYLSAAATLRVLDDERPSLNLVLPAASLTEGEKAIATLTLSHAQSSDTVVKLGSNLSGRLRFPATVSVKAGETTASFEVEVVQDTTAEIDKELTLVAKADGFNAAETKLTVVDDDIPAVSLSIDKTQVTESAGYYAITGVLTRSGNMAESITVQLKDADKIGLILPASIVMNANVETVTFNIGVADDNFVNGERSGKIQGTIILNSCGCSASASTNGGTLLSDAITILDNDGPAVTLALSRTVLREGGEETAELTVISNKVNEKDLVVTLSDSSGYLDMPATVTIPAGQLSVKVNLKALTDGSTSGNHLASITASAEGYSAGVAYVQVTDRDLPDLVISGIAVDKAVAGRESEVSVSIANQGFADLKNGYTLHLTLSNGAELGTFTVREPLAAGATVQQKLPVSLPYATGSHAIIATVSTFGGTAELDSANNSARSDAFNITSGYQVTAEVSKATLFSSEPITISGRLEAADDTLSIEGQTVYVYVRSRSGTMAIIPAETDAEGRYSVTYQPPATVAGTYEVSAGVYSERSETLCNFEMSGVSCSFNYYLKWDLALDRPQTGSFTITNTGNVTLHHVSMQVGDLPEGITLIFDGTDDVLEAGEKMTVNYTVSGNRLSTGPTYEEIAINVVSDEGVALNRLAYAYVTSVKGDIELNTNTIRETIAKDSGLRYFTVEVANFGDGETGEITVSLPDTPWLSLYSSPTIASLKKGETASVVLAVDSSNPDLLLNFDYSGYTVALNSENGGSEVVRLNMRFEETETAGYTVKLFDDYSIYGDSNTVISKARATLVGAYDKSLTYTVMADENGVCHFTDVKAGYYNIRISAEGCADFNKLVRLDAGSNLQDAVQLMNQNVVTTWNVVKKEYEEVYTVEQTAEFVTTVPRVDLKADDVIYIETLNWNEPQIVTYHVSNHGLVAARDYVLYLPTLDDIHFSVLNPTDTIDALSSYTFYIEVVWGDNYHGIGSGGSGGAGSSGGSGGWGGSGGTGGPGGSGSPDGPDGPDGPGGPGGPGSEDTPKPGEDGPAPCVEVWMPSQYRVCENGGWIEKTCLIKTNSCNDGGSNGIGFGGSYVPIIANNMSMKLDFFYDHFTVRQDPGGSGGYVAPNVGNTPQMVTEETECSDNTPCRRNLKDAFDACNGLKDWSWWDLLGLFNPGALIFGKILSGLLSAKCAYAIIDVLGQCDEIVSKEVRDKLKELADALETIFAFVNIVNSFRTFKAGDSIKNIKTAAKNLKEKGALKGLLINVADIVQNIKDIYDNAQTIRRHMNEFLNGRRSAATISVPGIAGSGSSLEWIYTVAIATLDHLMATFDVVNSLRDNSGAIDLAPVMLAGDFDGTGMEAWTAKLNEFMSGETLEDTKLTDEEMEELSNMDFVVNNGIQLYLYLQYEMWNKTVENKMQGIVSEADATDGEAFYSAEYEVALENLLRLSQTHLTELGYANDSIGSWKETYEELLKYINSGNSDGVCASVTLSFTQTITMSREYFEGSFSLKNNEAAELTDISFKVLVRDSHGVDVSDHFEVNYYYISDEFSGYQGGGAVSVTGGTLGAGQTGNMSISFVADKTIAAEQAEYYDFAATLAYTNGSGASVTMELAPVTLEVDPSPNLQLHYFLQEEIYADDPFTRKVEASRNADLGVMVINTGAGVAKNYRMSDFTIGYVSNESGLALDFNMKGVSLNGGELMAAGTDISFGDLAAHSTNSAVWYFNTNVQGRFTNYNTALITRTDAFGVQTVVTEGDRFSLIESAKTHSLVRSLDADGDGKTDFLVNDVKDLAKMADGLYLSTGEYADVHGVKNITVGSAVSADKLSVTAYVEEGYNYIRFVEPGEGHYKVVDVSVGADALDSAAYWQTDLYFAPDGSTTDEDRLHILYYAKSAGEVTFDITYTPVDDSAPEITAISGVDDMSMVVGNLDPIRVTFSEAVNKDSFSTDNVTLLLNSQAVDLSALSWHWTSESELVFDNMADLAKGDGLYTLTVTNEGVGDIYGNAGIGDGARISWTKATASLGVKYLSGAEGRRGNEKLNVIYAEFSSEVLLFPKNALHIVRVVNGTPSEVTDFSGLSITRQDAAGYVYAISGLNSIQTDDALYMVSIDNSALVGTDGVNILPGTKELTWNLCRTEPRIIRSSLVNAEKLNRMVEKVTLTYDHDISAVAVDKIKLLRDGVVATGYEITTAWKGSELEIFLTSADAGGRSSLRGDVLDCLEGSWVLVMDEGAVTDIYGNTSLAAADNEWVIDTTAPDTINAITLNGENRMTVAAAEVTLAATLPEAGLKVTVYNAAATNTALGTKLWSGVVEGTEFSRAFTLMQTGLQTINIVTEDAAGNSTTSSFSVMVDAVAIGLSTDLESTYDRLPESVTLTFSAAVEGMSLGAVVLRDAAGRAVDISGLSLTQSGEREWALSGLRGLDLADGNYTLEVDMSGLTKTASGLAGVGTRSASFRYDSVTSVEITDMKVVHAPSNLRSLSITFNTDINYESLAGSGLLPQAVRIVNQQSGEVTLLNAEGFSYSGTTLSWKGAQSLSMGDYAVVVDPALVSAANGAPLVTQAPALQTGLVHFSASGTLLFNTGNSYAAPLATDWNGDGFTDLLVGEKVGSNAGKVAIYLNNGQGVFTASGYVQADGRDLSVAASGCQGIVVALQDLNGDGIADLVAGLADGSMQYYLGKADNSFGTAQNLDLRVAERAFPTVADMNGDGVADLLIGSGDGKLFVSVGSAAADGSLSFASLTELPGVSVSGRAAPLVADVNGDGYADLIVGDADGKLNLFVNNGTAYSLVKTWNIDDVDWQRARITMADVDSDGVADLIVGGSTGAVYVLNGAADAVGKSFTVVETPAISETQAAVDGSKLTLSWVATGTLTDCTYTVQVATSADFSNATSYSGITENSYELAELGDGLYYWRVQVQPATGLAGTWANGPAAVVDMTAPDTVNGLNLQQSGSTATIVWQAVEDLSGVRYELRYSTDADFHTYEAVSVDNPSVTLSNLSDGVWHCQIRVIDGAGNSSDWGHASVFTVRTQSTGAATKHWAAGLAFDEQGVAVSGYNDVAKAGTAADSKLCWAAAASNVLAWWQTTYSAAQSVSTNPPTEADNIYNTFVGSWKNVSGRESVGFTWWISGSSENETYADYVSNYYRGDSATGAYYASGYTAAMTDALISEVNLRQVNAAAVGNDWAAVYDNGGMLTLGVYSNVTNAGLLQGGHAVTLWGFEQADANGALTAIYITDSDDGTDGIVKLDVVYNSDKNYYQVTESAGSLSGYYLGNYTSLGAYVEVLTDDTPEEATVISLEMNENGTSAESSIIRNRVGRTDAQDYYCFTAETAGSYAVNINASALTGSMVLSTFLLGENGEELRGKTVNIVEGSRFAGISDLTLAKGETCYIRVESVDGQDAAYEFSVQGDITTIARVTPNNSAAQATKLSAYESGSALEGWVGVGDETDIYRVKVTGDGTLRVKLSGLASSAKIKVMMQTEDGSLTQVVAKNVKASTGYNSSLSVADGAVYYVAVSSYNASAPQYDTYYQLSLEKDTPQADGSIETQVYGPADPRLTEDNTPETATLLAESAESTAISGWIGHGDACDYYRLDVSGNGSLSVSLQQLETSAKVRIYTEDENGELAQVVSKTVKAATGFDRTLSVLDGSVYYVQVLAYDDGAGRYNSGYSLTMESETEQEDGSRKTTHYGLASL